MISFLAKTTNGANFGPKTLSDVQEKFSKTSLTIEDLGRLPLETIAILSLFESYGYLNFSNQTLPSTSNPGLIF